MLQVRRNWFDEVLRCSSTGQTCESTFSTLFNNRRNMFRLQHITRQRTIRVSQPRAHTPASAEKCSCHNCHAYLFLMREKFRSIHSSAQMTFHFSPLLFELKLNICGSGIDAAAQQWSTGITYFKPRLKVGESNEARASFSKLTKSFQTCL